MPPLFSIDTERFSLKWSGPAGPLEPSAPAAMLRVRARRDDAVLRLRIEGATTELESELALAEQVDYQVFARSRHGDPIVLRNDDPIATRNLRADEGGSILSGTINFGGQVGRSQFVVIVGGVEEVAFELDIRPVKATLEHIETMRTEVEETISGLAFEYLRSTTTAAGIASDIPVHTTWLSIVRRVLPSLEGALGQISAKPLSELIRERAYAGSERIRRVDASVRLAMLRGRGGGARGVVTHGPGARELLPYRLAQNSLDTPEHRWLRTRLALGHQKLVALRQAEGALPLSERRRRTCEDIRDAEQRVAQLLRRPPLNNAQVTGQQQLPTQRLLTTPGYSEAYTACRALTFALDLSGGALPHATRDLHLLYEMWCYLTVVRRAAFRLGQAVPARAFFRTKYHGVRLMLQSGKPHRIGFADDDRSVQIAYNPRFGARLGLLTQRPDIVLTVTTAASARRYVLDAKYRRDDSAGYRRRYGAPGPPDSALGDLHRYRDAIVESVGGKAHRTVHQAIALYPYHVPEDEAFAETRLWSSIERVGVGAIPLLPGSTHYLDQWLAQVLP